MAFPDNTLSPATLEDVAKQIGYFTGTIAELPENKPLYLGESYPLWSLIPDHRPDKEAGKADLKPVPFDTKYWHHQVIQKDEATANEELIGFARSKITDTDSSSLTVQGFFQSTLAETINRASLLLLHTLGGNLNVRLLEIPPYQIHAFWIEPENSNKLLVFDAPDRFAAFRDNQIMPFQSLIDQILKQAPIIGIEL